MKLIRLALPEGLAETVEVAAARAGEGADPLEQGVRTALEEATNSLSAHLGQVDDKLERMLGRESSDESSG